MVEEKDYTVGTLTRQRRFVWAGWELIGEVDVNVNTGAKTMQRTFTWGPGLSGRIHGVAGIGGLLLVDQSSSQQTVAGGDGRGNVTVLLERMGGEMGARHGGATQRGDSDDFTWKRSTVTGARTTRTLIWLVGSSDPKGIDTCSAAANLGP